jgi:hypothetical protein
MQNGQIRDIVYLYENYNIYKIDFMFSEMDSKSMNTANQMMALGCIMIVCALTIGFSSVLLNEHRRENAQIEMGIQYDMAQILYTRQSIDALHQAVQHTACILLQAKWSAEMTMATILKTVEHAMQFHTDNSTVICPIYQ